MSIPCILKPKNLEIRTISCFALVIIVSYLAYGQVQPYKSTLNIGQGATINSITIIQGENIKTYNLSIAKDREQFLGYLKQLPDISQDMKKMLDKQDVILGLIKKGFGMNNYSEFDNNKFIKEIKRYSRQNDSLRKENERLLLLTTDSDFRKTLEKANIKLLEYDNEGYLQVLQDFKNQWKIIVSRGNKEYAIASYLQAFNNYINQDSRALANITEALEFDPPNALYQLFKGQILMSLNRNEESLSYFANVIESSNIDSLLEYAHYGMASSLIRLNKTRESLMHTTKQLEIAERRGASNCYLLNYYNDLAQQWYEEKNKYEALKCLNKSISLFGPEKSCSGIMFLLDPFCMKAKVLLDLGRIDSVQYFLEKSYSSGIILTEASRGSRENIQAEYYNKTKLYRQSLNHHIKAYIIWASNPAVFRDLTFNSLTHISFCYTNLNKLDSAILVDKKIISLLGDRKDERSIWAFSRIADKFSTLGKIDSSICYYEMILNDEEVKQTIPLNIQSVLFSNLGNEYYKVSKYNYSIKNQRISLKLIPQTVGFDDNFLRLVSLELGKSFFEIDKIDSCNKYVNIASLINDSSKMYFEVRGEALYYLGFGMIKQKKIKKSREYLNISEQLLQSGLPNTEKTLVKCQQLMAAYKQKRKSVY